MFRINKEIDKLICNQPSEHSLREKDNAQQKNHSDHSKFDQNEYNNNYCYPDHDHELNDSFSSNCSQCHKAAIRPKMSGWNTNLINDHNKNNYGKQNNHNQELINNSFSYTCPYVQSQANTFFHFGFPQLNQIHCPHIPSNVKNQVSNTKNYSKRMIQSLDLPKNKIHLDNVLKLKDKRTTIIIRHIPNKYTLDLLLQEINPFFLYKYDAIYLPIDSSKNTNLGFGFINFIDPIHLIYFFDEFNLKTWNLFHSHKQCQLAYAKIQGKDSLMKYIQKRLGNNEISNTKSFYFFENVMSQLEIPMKYYEVFTKFYPYSLCRKKDAKIFIIESYFNF